MPGDTFRHESFSDVLTRLGTHPSAEILAALENGARRLSELGEGPSRLDEAELAAALRELDGAGLIARRVDSGPPLRVLYALTERGATLAPALGRIVRYLETNR